VTCCDIASLGCPEDCSDIRFDGDSLCDLPLSALFGDEFKHEVENATLKIRSEHAVMEPMYGTWNLKFSKYRGFIVIWV